MTRALWQPLLRKAAQSYIAGARLTDALRLARRFGERGITASTLCFWDGPEDRPGHVAEMYRETVGGIEKARLDSYVSIKAPSLGYDAELIGEIAKAAAAAGGVRVHFDSLGVETADRTFAEIEQARGYRVPLGCTVPGRWRRSPQDAAKAAGMGLRVRVVKGQWADPDGPVEAHAGFLDVIEALAGGAAPVAVATHHPGLAAAAIGKLRAAGTSCELELLYGLPSRAVMKVARDLEVAVRYYLPYGHAWLPYALRQARRDPRILWWVVRDAAG